MDFIDKKGRLFLVHPASFERGIDHILELSFTGQYCGERLKMGLGAIGNDLGQGGLAGTGWAPQDDRREQPVRFDSTSQQFSRADDMFLPDKFVQRSRAHPGSQGSLGIQTFLHSVVEQVAHGKDYTA
jgi:hypothetical protein